METQERFDFIKITIGKGGKKFYYVKTCHYDAWRKISEQGYNLHIEHYSGVAVEKELNDKGEIVYMKYKHENSQQWKERMYGKKLFNKKPGCFFNSVFIFSLFVYILIKIFS